MNAVRLRVLREVARCGTMAAAAEALFLSPSAVSQQIAQLEMEAGVPLTKRDGRGVRLTPAGLALVSYAERVMEVLDEAKTEMAKYRREIVGELRIAAFPSIASVLLPNTIKSLKQDFPRLCIVVDEMESLDCLAALRSWRADMALVDDLPVMFTDRHEGIDHLPLTEDLLFVLVPEGHELARRESVSIAELRGETWALNTASGAFGDFIISLCRLAGYEPHINAACKSFTMVAAMVSSGCSVSVAPGLRLTQPIQGIRAIRLCPEVRRKTSAAYRSGEKEHPAIRVLLQHLLRNSGDGQPS